MATPTTARIKEFTSGPLLGCGAHREEPRPGGHPATGATSRLRRARTGTPYPMPAAAMSPPPAWSSLTCILLLDTSVAIDHLRGHPRATGTAAVTTARPAGSC